MKLSFVFSSMLVEDEMRTVNLGQVYADADGDRRHMLLTFPDFLEALCRLVAMVPALGGQAGAEEERGQAASAVTYQKKLNRFLKMLLLRLDEARTNAGGMSIAKLMDVNHMVNKA